MMLPPAQAFVAKLNAAGQRWVPILDPPIHVSPGYAAYDSGIADDVFLKDITGRPFVGQVPYFGSLIVLHHLCFNPLAQHQHCLTDISTAASSLHARMLMALDSWMACCGAQMQFMRMLWLMYCCRCGRA
jgi:hypothetical protein